ncbi:MAG: hypothetical protein V4723_09225 [Pseudomonadota bacterium]
MSSSTIDSGNPWLGLASFSEETRQYFYGREEEVGDLTRRIQRKLLTVLFGQSGLGKTSILRAGIVPRLRAQGYCPVYVRVDYGPDVPSASEQIKQGIISATADAGTWTRSGSAREGESLWEFLHHRGDVLLDAQGKPLIPLLIFDQFEEIFTLAQTDDAGRAHAAHFMAALAELVENRAPPALEARLEEDDDAAADFDFARSDYRILISLREDYLAHLESLKAAMPSITQNRMRLAPMTGLQALSAVSGPGGKLVSSEVAEAIVRFVAGGAELANAQVEPSLLSLICRELNDKRIHADRAEISMDLLAGSHASILTDFYERSLADQPPAVRRVIEDVLLTDSGYRENVAEERVRNALAAAGAKPDTLSVLVNRRLLRIEDRLDIRRVELTHDVLCSVVGASREQRHEREQQVAAERALTQQLEREQETHRSLLKARKVMAGCVVLAGAAVASAVFGYVKLRDAQETRAVANESRAQAEKLIGYVVDDFYDDLDPIGRVDLLTALSSRTDSYYRNLPLDMRTPASEVNRALSIWRLASNVAKTYGADENAADKLYAESIDVLTKLSASNPRTESIELALARVLSARGTFAYRRGDLKLGRDNLERAVAAAAAYGGAPRASLYSRIVYGTALRNLGHFKIKVDEVPAASTHLELAVRVANPGSTADENGELAVVYVVAAASWHEALMRAKDPRSEKVAFDAIAVGQSYLKKNPESSLVTAPLNLLAINRSHEMILAHYPSKGLAIASANSPGLAARLKRDPSNRLVIDSLSILLAFEADALADLGRPDEALPRFAQVMSFYEKAPPNLFHRGNLEVFAERYGMLQAELGLDAELQKTYAQIIALSVLERAGRPDKDLSKLALMEELSIKVNALGVLYGTGDFSQGTASRKIIQTLTELVQARPSPAIEKRRDDEYFGHIMARIADLDSRVAMQRNDYATVEKMLRHHSLVRSGYESEARYWKMRMRHAFALVHLQREPEAISVFQREADEFRKLIAKGSDSQAVRIGLIEALVGLSLARKEAGEPVLREAADMLEQVPATMQPYRSIRYLRGQIAGELKKRGMPPSSKITSAVKPLQS